MKREWTNYFLGIEDRTDKTDNDRFDGYIHKAIIGYHGPEETEDRINFIEPEGITWLDGEQFKIGVRNKPPGKYPVVSNRPTANNSDSLTEETLSYERTIIGTQSPERTAIYHPINSDGLLEVLLNGERRKIRVTLVAEYFERSGILQDNFNVVELYTPDQDQIPAIAA